MSDQPQPDQPEAQQTAEPVPAAAAAPPADPPTDELPISHPLNETQPHPEYFWP